MSDMRFNPLILSTATRLIRPLVLVVVAILVVRTWFVLGLVEPVTVSGSSMAPAYRGPHVVATCERCHEEFTVGAEFALRSRLADCFHCGERGISLADLTIQRGDVLWIDRTAFQRRDPQRWEPVVFASPEEGGQLVVKRVVGLPGERVTLHEGDLWIDGDRVAKSLDQQRSLRQQVHKERTPHLRWQSESGRWTWVDGHWQYAGELETPPDDWDWLEYRHPQGVVTDELAYNARLTQRLETVHDLGLSATVHMEPQAQFTIQLADGRHEVRLIFAGSRIEVSTEGRHRTTVEIPLERHQACKFRCEVSTFDRQLLVAIDDKTRLRQQLGESLSSSHGRLSLAVGARRGSLAVAEIAVYRDLHYTVPEHGPQAARFPLQLGPDEYFVLGDNVPVSVDSRHWGPLPRRFLVGNPRGR